MTWGGPCWLSRRGGLLFWLLPVLLKSQPDKAEMPRPCQKTPLLVSCRGQRLPAFPQGLGRDVKQIDLAHNSIASLTDRDASSLEHLEYLDLSANRLQAVSQRALQPLVRLRSLRLAANRLFRNHSSNGKAFLALGGLEVLDLSANSLDDAMAISYLGNLPSLRQLDLSWNLVTRLSRGIFRGVPKLQEINLKNNGIAAIEEGSLEALESLRVLNLAMNSLRCISSFSLVQVQVLNLSYNALESFMAGGEAREVVYQLQVLDLSHNQLASLPLVPRRNRLLYLNLSHNAIAQLAANGTQTEQLALGPSSRQASLVVGVSQSFRDATLGLAKIRLLDLSSNQLSSFPVTFLHTLSSLHTLSMARNCLQGMEGEGLPIGCHLPGGKEPVEVLSVRKLDLQGNLVRSLPRCFFDLLPHLETMDLALNRIRLCRALHTSESEGPSVDGCNCTAFRHGPQLRHLSLRGNQLAVVHSHPFSQTPLSSLDLSENEGLFLPEGALEGLESSLQKFSLKGNQMRTSDLSFPCLGQLKTLDLSGNKLSSLPPGLLPCSRLEKLDIQQNCLRSLEEAAAAQLARSLHSLSLAGNPWSCCELRWLDDVILGAAAVTVLDWEDTSCSYHDGQKNVTVWMSHSHAWPCSQRLRSDYLAALLGVAAGLSCSLCLACATCCFEKKAKRRLLLDLGFSSSRVEPAPNQSKGATSGQNSADNITKV